LASFAASVTQVYSIFFEGEASAHFETVANASPFDFMNQLNYLGVGIPP
jgi:hypothetical protein